MSTSLRYHGFGIRGYTYLRTEYHRGQVVFTIRPDPDTLRCSGCGSRDVRSRGQAERRFKSLPIGGKPVSIVLAIPRVACAVGKALRQVAIGFAERRGRYDTKRQTVRTRIPSRRRLRATDEITCQST